MSLYTTELRFICEHLAGYDQSQDYSKTAEIIESARPKIFDFDFPIYDETYRSILETKILRNYYFDEIGFETYGRFKMALENKLNLIMPYYNDLYKSASLEYDPLYSVDYYEKHEGKGDGKENSNGSGKDTRSLNLTDTNTGTQTNKDVGNNWTKFSDTPQGGTSQIDLATDAYLTNATLDKIDDTVTRTDNLTHKQTGTDTLDRSNTNARTYNNTDEYLNHVYGKQAGQSYASLIKEYRETLLNIDLLIINELRDLFMLLY